MARHDRLRWNKRYGAETYDFTPNRWLKTIATRIGPSRSHARALDLVSGGGRNALFLAEVGYAVDAWDVSDAGLAILRAELKRRHAEGSPLKVYPRRVDLESASMPIERYDLVLNTFFLLRSRLADIAQAVRPGGLLLFETFVDWGEGRHPHVTPEHTLRRGELLETYACLEILEYGEDVDTGTARLLARRPEQSGGDDGRRGPTTDGRGATDDGRAKSHCAPADRAAPRPLGSGYDPMQRPYQMHCPAIPTLSSDLHVRRRAAGSRSTGT